jgi:methylenetetrahydrofolate reductase (NADPH)
MEKLQWPVDWSLQGTSAYGNVLNGKWFTPQWSDVLDQPRLEEKAGTQLENALNSGHFVVTAELEPPRSANIEPLRRKAELLRGKVTAVNITDNSLATVHLSSLAGCLVLQAAGIEPILQMTCRDRNRLALQSDLLSAAALGIGNVLLLTGDHPCYGDDPEAMGVFDLDSISLLALARRMRDNGQLISGKAIPTPPRLLLGAAANPEGEPLDLQVLRLEKKVRAGADFIQTQAVFDIDHFKQWMRAVRARGLHQAAKILVGIVLLNSAEQVRYLQENVPGMRISDALVERFSRASSYEEEGRRLGRELIQSCAEIEGVAGVHLMTIDWEDAIPEVLAEAHLV